MSRIETVSSDLKVLVRPGVVLPAQQVAPQRSEEAVVLPESPHQAAIAPDPVVVAEPPAPAPAPVKAKPARKRRARKADGTYQGDNPSTPDKDEAWEG